MKYKNLINDINLINYTKNKNDMLEYLTLIYASGGDKKIAREVLKCVERNNRKLCKYYNCNSFKFKIDYFLIDNFNYKIITNKKETHILTKNY